MRIWTQIFWLTALICLLKISAIIFNGRIRQLHKKNLQNKIVYGLASRKDLADLSTGQFIAWCIPILQYFSVSDIQIRSKNPGDVLQLSGCIGNRKVYIKCINLQLLDDPKDKLKTDARNRDDYKAIGSPQLRELVGLMEHDRVDLGFILTNGDFSKESKEYAKKIIKENCGISLELIDGCKLTRLHRSCQKQYVTAGNALGGI
jgi:hypothetical protein